MPNVFLQVQPLCCIEQNVLPITDDDPFSIVIRLHPALVTIPSTSYQCCFCICFCDSVSATARCLLWDTYRFCFWALASLTLVRKVFWDGILTSV